MSVYLPEKDYTLPDVDLLTLIFDHPLSWGKEDTVVHAEADDPSNAITKAEARAYTKRIAYHLRNSYGIGKNGPGKDVVVCISSGQILGTSRTIRVQQEDWNINAERFHHCS
jgi:4-coumarate--CoA ligase